MVQQGKKNATVLSAMCAMWDVGLDRCARLMFEMDLTELDDAANTDFVPTASNAVSVTVYGGYSYNKTTRTKMACYLIKFLLQHVISVIVFVAR
jgi:hypothetical protein